MPSISYDSFMPWSNYHLTIGSPGQGGIFPQIRVEDTGQIHCADQVGVAAVSRFAATGAILMGHLQHVLGMMAVKAQGPEHLGSPFAAGMVGRGWSFSPLIGAPTSQLKCEGLSGCVMLNAASFASGTDLPVGKVALVSGGTRLREIVTWAEGFGLTVETSGTHLGPTVAGTIATASHGSRLGFGGIQNMIVGLHLITGPSEHVWIERHTHHVLSDAAAADLDINAAPGAKTIRIIRDDHLFEDALVHLGGMGIVNCVAIKLVENEPFDLLKLDCKVTPDWLHALENAQFQKIAASLGRDEPPVFYEATLNPHDPFGPSALHTMYFRTHSLIGPSGENAKVIRPSDAIAQFGLNFSISALAEMNPALFDAVLSLDRADLFKAKSPLHPAMSVFDIRTKTTSGYDYYRETGSFQQTPAPPGPSYYWSGLHHDEITGGMPGALYNASFAIPLNQVSRAIPAICDAVKHLPMAFVFTIRFVSNPAGTLAFTRFEENAVIEIDGLSPLVCALRETQLDPADPKTPGYRKMLALLKRALPDGAKAVRAALDGNHISYSMHWGKLGELDRQKVYSDFGDPGAGADSLIKRWRQTRDQLLGDMGKAVFWNEAQIRYGLLDQPQKLPPLP